VRQLCVFGAVLVAMSAAWPLAVSLWPGSTPYIGGSTDGSVWDLILGYNGFGRLTGSEGGVGGGGGASFGGVAGLWRMFNAEVGGQVAWLLPLAAVSLVAGLWVTRRAPRASLQRAAWILFGVWALVHVAVFSSQKGIFHPYYVSAPAPAVAALSGAGVVTLWRWSRRSWLGWTLLAASVAATAWLAVSLLARTPDFAPWLRVAVPAAAVVAVLASPAHRSRGVLAVAAVAGAFALLAGPASYSIANLSRSLDGNNVTAGPSSASMGEFGGGQVSNAMVSYLLAHQGSAKYLLAATGSQATAPIIIETGKAVVTIGGFNGGDDAPTLAQLEAMVAKGELRYVLVSGGGPGGNSELASWVIEHGTEVSGYAGLYRVSS
jgi:hypothetical protein